MTTLALVTSIVGLFLQLCLAVLLVRRMIPQLFPMFLAYVVFSAGATIAKLCVSSDYRAYYFVYWGTEAIAVLLATLALLEVFRWVFALFWLSGWFRWLSYGFIVLTLSLPVANAIRNPPAHMDRLGGLIFSAGITVNFIQAAIFLLFWLLSKSLEIGFRRYAFGIVLGFGASSCGTLIGWFARYIFGTKFNFFAMYLPPVAYIYALGFWLHVFWRKEPTEEERSLPLTPEELAEQMRRYTELMKQYTRIMKR
jgi:hypothetical protein